jgi:hypothetical protein
MRFTILKRLFPALLICIVILVQILCLVACGSKNADNATQTPNGNENSFESGDDENKNETCIVRFVTSEGIPISIQECSNGESLVPPTPPRKIGHIFTGWDGDYNNITKSTDITATYIDVSKVKNAISADTMYVAGTSEFEVLIGIYGDVGFCGLDMDITYDSNLFELIASTDVDDCVVVNTATKGVIHMNYVTMNNTTGEVAFMTLKFKVKATTNTETGLQITVNSMYEFDNNDSIIQSDYQVIQNKIIIEEAHNEQ